MWRPRPSSTEAAFLALDRNGHHRIDDGGELFADPHCAANGCEEVAEFDANHDHSIVSVDPVFADLQLLYGDGTTTSWDQQGSCREDRSTLQA